MDRFRCSAASVARGEPVLGTASRVDRWVLVEAPGPWGPRALPQTRAIDDEQIRALQQRAKAAHARTLLIRRPGATGPARRIDGDRLRVFLADSRPGRERLQTRLAAPADLGGLELPFDGPTAAWDRAPALIGVCTHGTHDVCCAVRGRPVAAALAGAYPEATWEISHIGGDRFAANVLVLPGGHYLGQLPPAEAVAALTTLLAGGRPDPWYRGRSCWSTPAQAAIALYGAEAGLTGLDALYPVRLDGVGPGTWRVLLRRVDRNGHDSVAVVVQQREGPETSMLTCHAGAELPVPSWHLLEASADQARTAPS